MHVKLYYERDFYRFIMVTPVRLLRIITWLFRRLLFFFFLFLFLSSSDFKRQFRTPRSGTSFRGTGSFVFQIRSVRWRVNSYIHLLTLCSTVEL